MRQSELEAAFHAWIASVPDIPEPTAEYTFAPPRRWRFDFAWPAERVAVEVDGAIFAGGRHGRGRGILGDAEKLEAALVRGWRVYRVPSHWIVYHGKPVHRPEVVETLRGLLRGERAE